MADVAWSHGSLVTPPTPNEPASLGNDDSIAALLDEAEEIVRAAGPSVIADLDAERAREAQRSKGLLGRLRGRRNRKKDQ